MLFGHELNAFQVESSFNLSEKNGLEKNSLFICQAQESFCMNLCRNQDKCMIPETLCIDCLSQKSQDITIIYSEPHTYFQSQNKFVNLIALSYYFKNKKFLLLDYQSFMNYKSPEKTEVHLNHFQQFCSNNSLNNLIILDIDPITFSIKSIPGIICQSEAEQSYVLPLEVKTEFKKIDQLDLWKSINLEVYQKILDLKFKMDYGLKIPSS